MITIVFAFAFIKLVWQSWYSFSHIFSDIADEYSPAFHFLPALRFPSRVTQKKLRRVSGSRKSPYIVLEISEKEIWIA